MINNRNPVVVEQLMALESMGVSSQSFRFGLLTMESDRYISVKDVAADGSASLLVVDMCNGNAVSKKPTKAEASLMHMTENIVALRGKTEGQPGHFIQVYNLDLKEKIGVTQMSENIVFWRWVGPRILAVVTEKSVYHWSITQGASESTPPEKVFDRAGKLAEATTQIINYATDSRSQWCLLIGISTMDNGKTVDGSMQLYSVEKKQQQMLDGHAACFAKLPIEDPANPVEVLAFLERKPGTSVTKLHVLDIYRTSNFKVSMEVEFPQEGPAGDFAVALSTSVKHGLVYAVTKGGCGFVFDVRSGRMLYRGQVSGESIFLGVGSPRTGGLYFVNRRGQVFSFRADEENFVNSIVASDPTKAELAFGLVRLYSLKGCDDLFTSAFNTAFSSGDYAGAAKIVAQSKSSSLRNPRIMSQFRDAANIPGVTARLGGASPLLLYFSAVLESGGKLSSPESIELARLVLAQGRKEFIEKWIREDKLEPSEELGDLVRPLDSRLAFSMYSKAGKHDKAVACLVEAGQFDQVASYVKQTGAVGDYTFIVRNMLTVNPDAALKFVRELVLNVPPLMDLGQATELFLSYHKVAEVTSLLMDALKGDKTEHARLQTKLLEINLLNNPQAAEAIFQTNMFSKYDRQYIGGVCERVGLFQRALEHMSEPADIKRIMVHSSSISPDFLVAYLGRLAAQASQQSTPAVDHGLPQTQHGAPTGQKAAELAVEVMTELLRHNKQAGLQVAIQVCVKHWSALGLERLVKMFESIQSAEGLFYFLGGVLPACTDPEIHFKYIEAACKLGQISEVERVVRESKAYDPVKVKEFLKAAKLSDPRPLIYACDIHGFVEDLTTYLYRNGMSQFLEVYVVKVNPLACPKVIGTLLDLDAGESEVKALLSTARATCPIGPLVDECEKRNRLKMLQPWLEARQAEGMTDVALHNALAKIYVDLNRDPETFLKTNSYYDPASVGKYCESRDPLLAFVVYRKAWGKCDEDLVRVAAHNGLHRHLARYLVERQNVDLWGSVLNGDAELRKGIVDQVVSTVLPESKNADEISVAVKAFIAAEMPMELMELLEKIVLRNTEFASNKNLQNLLILTAIKADRSRVMDYVQRLNNYDAPEIATVALGEPHRLYDEAFQIYKKANMLAEAMDTLLINMSNLPKAAEFASRCANPLVYYKLGRAQLDAGMVADSIESFLKADDPRDYMHVVDAAEREDLFEELVVFLRMARRKLKDQYIDTELIYSLAKLPDKAAELEEFLRSPNIGNVQGAGDRLFDEKLFKGAKAVFAEIPNHSRLCACHLALGDFQLAVESAKRANNSKTWKDVCAACVAAGEFKFAAAAGTHVIANPDYLEELVGMYERAGHVSELLSLLEVGVANDSKAHVGLYTELAVQYAKTSPSKMNEYIKVYSGKMNIPRAIRACESAALWKEAVYLYVQYEEFDSALSLTMAHSPAAWSHDEFLLVAKRVTNAELLYKAVAFYLEEHPLQLNALLMAVSSRLDAVRVVDQLKKAGHLPLIKQYLQSAQGANLAGVNNALNELHVEEEDFEDLRKSIETYDNFDQLSLAARLERHEVAEARKIAAALYVKNKKFKQGLELSKQDGQFDELVQTAAASQNCETVESLLKYFLEKQQYHEFGAALFVCYGLIRPDVVLELAWRYHAFEAAFPYIVQVMRHTQSRLDAVEKKLAAKENHADPAASSGAAQGPGPLNMMPALMPGSMGTPGTSSSAFRIPPKVETGSYPLGGGLGINGAHQM